MGGGVAMVFLGGKHFLSPNLIEKKATSIVLMK